MNKKCLLDNLVKNTSHLILQEVDYDIYKEDLEEEMVLNSIQETLVDFLKEATAINKSKEK